MNFFKNYKLFLSAYIFILTAPLSSPAGGDEESRVQQESVQEQRV